MPWLLCVLSDAANTQGTAFWVGVVLVGVGKPIFCLHASILCRLDISVIYQGLCCLSDAVHVNVDDDAIVTGNVLQKGDQNVAELVGVNQAHLQKLHQCPAQCLLHH